jgi:membrane protein implicated in regulation of membrane protease activity
MAKKLPKARTSTMVLFIELLIPWIVMAIIGVSAISIGLSDVTSIVIALIGALATTLLVRTFERNRLRKKQMSRI